MILTLGRKTVPVAGKGCCCLVTIPDEICPKEIKGAELLGRAHEGRPVGNIRPGAEISRRSAEGRPCRYLFFAESHDCWMQRDAEKLEELPRVVDVVPDQVFVLKLKILARRQTPAEFTADGDVVQPYAMRGLPVSPGASVGMSFPDE